MFQRNFKSASLPKEIKKLTQSDYQKIKLPQCSSLYSEFHYKVARKDLQYMIHHKHQLVINNLESLRVQDAKIIKSLQKQVEELKNQLKIANQHLDLYKAKTKEFITKKLVKVQEQVERVLASVGKLQGMEMERFKQYCLKTALKFEAFQNTFSLQEAENLMNQLISETVKKSFFCDQIARQTLLKLELISSAQVQEIHKLRKQCNQLILTNSEYEVRFTQINDKYKEVLPFVDMYEDQVSKMKKMNLVNESLMEKIEELENWKKNKINVEKKEKQIEQKYVQSLNQFSESFALPGDGSIEELLKEEMNLKDQYAKLDKKSLQVLFREKISFILHLFRKFEHRNNEQKLKLLQKMSYLEQEINSQCQFIAKQTKIIREAEKRALKKNEVSVIEKQQVKTQGSCRIRITSKSRKLLKL